MLCVIFARLDFQRKGAKVVVVVNDKIHLAILLVVVIVQRETVRVKFLSHNRFVNRSEIDAFDVLQYRINIKSIQKIGQKSDIIEVKFYQTLLLRFFERGKPLIPTFLP